MDSNIQDAAIALFTNLPIVALDNLDGKISWLDDLLATAATGGKIPLRKLYETNSLLQVRLRPHICATSRDPQNFARDDVADRTLVLRVERGDRAGFVSEGVIQNDVSLNRPKAWRAVLDVLSKMIAALSAHKPEVTNHRMADFANFALAIGPVLGYSELKVRGALDRADQAKRALVSEHSSLGQVLEQWVSINPSKLGKWVPVGDLFARSKAA